MRALISRVNAMVRWHSPDTADHLIGNQTTVAVTLKGGDDDFADCFTGREPGAGDSSPWQVRAAMRSEIRPLVPVPTPAYLDKLRQHVHRPVRYKDSGQMRDIRRGQNQQSCASVPIWACRAASGDNYQPIRQQRLHQLRCAGITDSRNSRSLKPSNVDGSTRRHHVVGLRGASEMVSMTIRDLIVVVALMFGSLGAAATAHADSNDQRFLAALKSEGISDRVSPAHAIDAAHTVCQKLDGGETLAQVVNEVLNNSSMPAYHSGFFVGAAIKVYCPQYMP